MATMITDDCIHCGACLDECPNEAIHFVDGHPGVAIDPDRCTECVGFHGREACQEECPVDCCLPDPSRPETEGELLAKARRLHPAMAERLVATPLTSRFRRG
jgi:ferredoxin